jgi:hypothetical protein
MRTQACCGSKQRIIGRIRKQSVCGLRGRKGSAWNSGVCVQGTNSELFGGQMPNGPDRVINKTTASGNGAVVARQQNHEAQSTPRSMRSPRSEEEPESHQRRRETNVLVR